MIQKEFRIKSDGYEDIVLVAIWYKNAVGFVLEDSDGMLYDSEEIVLRKLQATQLRDWLNEALEGMG